MQSGQVLICVDESSGLTFGKKYIADTTCNALGRVTLVGQQGLFDFGTFVKPFQKISAGEWWVTRDGIVVLVNHVVSGQVVAAFPADGDSVHLELFYESGRFSQTVETERDLIFQASHGEWRIGDRVNLSRRGGLFEKFAPVREESHVGAFAQKG